MTQQDTARNSLPIDQNTLQVLEMTNRSHLAHAPMTYSDPAPVTSVNG